MIRDQQSYSIVHAVVELQELLAVLLVLHVGSRATELALDLLAGDRAAERVRVGR